MQVYFLHHLERYSASLWGTTLDQMLVAVGTVFNEVLIWQPFHLMKSVQQRMFITSVHKRLKGHEVARNSLVL